ncbi:TPA: hypothetical protein IAA68_07665 [Candidatus Galligastranaerophilus faecipullorum]|nr:hypothetical protein [Candidatus Galligastranaerophilus faecipullorum]
MSGNYSVTSFGQYWKDDNYNAGSNNSSAYGMSDSSTDASIFGGDTSAYASNPYENVFGTDVDYSSQYDSIIDSFHKQLDDIRAAQAEEEAQAGDDNDGDDTSVDGSDPETGTEPSDTEPSGDEPAGDEPAGDEPAGDEPAAYTDEELSLIYNTAQDILDATVRYESGLFGGTDEEAFIEALSNEKLTPELMQGVQAQLKAEGHDLFDLIRSETSGGTEDVLEGYALAKLGGESKESGTKLESYGPYQDMDKSSVEYKNYIRKCVSLFKTAVNGAGTDEKVLAYVMSLPDDIRADVEAQYNEKYGKDTKFMDRGKKEVSGVLKDEYWS